MEGNGAEDFAEISQLNNFKYSCYRVAQYGSIWLNLAQYVCLGLGYRIGADVK